MALVKEVGRRGARRLVHIECQQSEHPNPDLAGRSELLPLAEGAHSSQWRLAPGVGFCPAKRGFPDAIADGTLRPYIPACEEAKLGHGLGNHFTVRLCAMSTL